MPDEPPSQMIRVPTPLVEVVRELSRLHRQGRTKAVLEGVQRLIQVIDSEADIDIDSVAEAISRLTERLDRLEAQQVDSRQDIDIDSAIQPISKRLEKLESDVGAIAKRCEAQIAQTIEDLSPRVSDLEGVTPWQQDQAAIATDVKQIAELSVDIDTDSNTIAEAADQGDISSDVEQIAEPQPPAPLTQSALAKRLRCSDKAIEKHRKQDSKENFAAWSRDRDPEGVSWSWEGTGGRGQPLRFAPLASTD